MQLINNYYLKCETVDRKQKVMQKYKRAAQISMTVEFSFIISN